MPLSEHFPTDPYVILARSGVSVRGRVAGSEKDVPDDKLEDYIVSWPGRVPKAARKKVAAVRGKGRGRKKAAKQRP